eukprot:Seg2873.2 transcript_id=Seg2873.2/GoldUCD/mRNA.D3Y31 product="Polyglutamine-binding protein 1" protein_id=Seg2873.2/GoldUCD/D3Y31
MPLPTALQARLQKRGLIKQEEPQEIKEDDTAKKECPNAWNPYHTCVKFCEEHWGIAGAKGKGNSKKSTEAKPLPPGWFLVPDSKSGHSYFWNVHTNMVSWVHPQDPRADITLPASFQLGKESQLPPEQPAVPGEEENTENEPNESRKEEDKKLPPKVKTGKHPSLLKAQRDKGRTNPYKSKNNKREELDPMDPAAYSDVPRGDWNSGLREDRDVKTGVDTTANGPLFQQRPYPSPGEVLRRNRQNQPPPDED